VTVKVRLRSVEDSDLGVFFDGAVALSVGKIEADLSGEVIDSA
jgi:hypothetical protein